MITKLHHPKDHSIFVNLPDQPYEVRYGSAPSLGKRFIYFDFDHEEIKNTDDLLELISAANKEECTIVSGLDNLSFGRAETDNELQDRIATRLTLVKEYNDAKDKAMLDLDALYATKHKNLINEKEPNEIANDSARIPANQHRD